MDKRDLNFAEVDATVQEALVQEAKGKKVKFTTIEVIGSKGQKYKIAAPSSYYVPRVWKWDAEKYYVAELLAAGVSVQELIKRDDVKVNSKNTIYGWLQHPEFKEHVEWLTLETGIASKRERIASMKRVLNMMADKIIKHWDQIDLNDKNVVAFLNAYRDYAKYIAQEKEEFVEQTKVEQEVHADVKGTVATTSVDLEQYLASLEEDEREKMEREFSKVADQYIRQLTG